MKENKEEDKNIVSVCSDCVEKRRKRVIHDYNVGDFVKKRFIGKNGEKELMWVFILEIYLNKIIGSLANEPLGDFDIKLNSIVELEPSEVIQVLKKGRDFE